MRRCFTHLAQSNVKPLVLAYPQVWDALRAEWRVDSHVLPETLAKCFSLAAEGPSEPLDHGGYLGLDGHHALFTVWSDQEDKPDFFILAGWGDGFGPGHTCPNAEALRRGNYGCLRLVPFLW